MNSFKRVTNVVMFLTAFALVANQANAMNENPEDQIEEVEFLENAEQGQGVNLLRRFMPVIVVVLGTAIMVAPDVKNLIEEVSSIYQTNGYCQIPGNDVYCVPGNYSYQTGFCQLPDNTRFCRRILKMNGIYVVLLIVFAYAADHILEQAFRGINFNAEF